MDRLSVFIAAENEAGHVQAVIRTVDLPHFKRMGFAENLLEMEQLLATEAMGTSRTPAEKDGADTKRGPGRPKASGG